MSNIQVEKGTVEVRCDVAILSVGEGDTKLSFDPSNPQERIRAARIVADMLRRGYALMIEMPGDNGTKTYKRVHAFDEAACEYIIADLDPLAAQAADEAAASEGRTDEQTAETTPAEGRSKLKERRIPAESARAVSVGRTAGG